MPEKVKIASMWESIHILFHLFFVGVFLLSPFIFSFVGGIFACGRSFFAPGRRRFSFF
jgi:hypothetical protein